MKLTLLDCTLRDGGNQNNWQFTTADVTTIIETLDNARVDVIEVGYRGGSGSADVSTAGPSVQCPPSYLAALPNARHATLAVMVVPTMCPVTAMDDLADSPIGMVRVAVYPWDIGRVPEYVRAVRRLGLKVSVNIMAISYVSPAKLRAAAEIVSAEPPDVVYMADSFGALTPDEIRARVEVLAERTGCQVGIHAHNNLGLGVSNALAAVDAGANWVDASLCAMARGAGNLATEQAAAIFARWPRYGANAEVTGICDASEYVAEQVLPRPMPVRRAEIAAGINDHHYYFQHRVDKIAARFGLDPWAVGREIGTRRPHKVSDELVEHVCQNIAAGVPA